jgi:hypothetical protein
MAPQAASCPVCKQKFMIQPYVTVGSTLACVNCESTLRVDSSRPLKISLVPYKQTLTAVGRPESYG